MHARTQLRNALMAALAGLPGALTIEAERRHRLDATLLPAVLVTLGDDTADADQRAMGTGPYTVERNQSVIVELHASGATGLEVAEALDALEVSAEAAIAADVTLGGIAELVSPIESTLETSVDQETVIAVRALVYSVAWRSTFGQPDQPEG